MTAAADDAASLISLTESVGRDLHSDKAAQVLSRLASREAQRKAQAEQQSADQRHDSPLATQTCWCMVIHLLAGLITERPAGSLVL